jgi:multiple sugar transport system substrate-binding protein
MNGFNTSLNRRRLLQASAAAVGSASIAGSAAQASPRPGGNRQNRAAQDATSVRALMWTNGPIIDGHFEDRLRAFNEAHEGSISVDLQFLPWDQYWQRLQLAYASGDIYDVYFWDTQAYGHYKRDLLLNLQPMIDESGYLDPNEYPMDLFEPWRLDGENLYGVPENLQTLALYYNTDLFDAEGIEYPDDSWSYDNVLEAALAMTKREGNRTNQWGMSLGTLGIWWGMQTISWAKGDAFFDQIVEPTQFQFSNPANVETLDFVRSLVHDHEVAPSPSVNEQNPDVTGFASGRVGLVLDGSWNLSTYAELPFGWGVAPIPLVEGNRVVPYWMGGWVIAAESEVAEAAFEWARWSAQDYQQQMAAERDWIPVLNSARESAEATEGMPEGYRAVIDSLENARLGDVYSDNTQQIWVEVFEPKMSELLNQNRPAEEVAPELDEQANALLDS